MHLFKYFSITIEFWDKYKKIMYLYLQFKGGFLAQNSKFTLTFYTGGSYNEQ